MEDNLNKALGTESGTGSAWWGRGDGEHSMKIGGKPVESSHGMRPKCLLTCNQGGDEVSELTVGRVR